jgi:hypothetical protein
VLTERRAEVLGDKRGLIYRSNDSGGVVASRLAAVTVVADWRVMRLPKPPGAGRIPDPPKRAENRDMIKKRLTCIVFVPRSWVTMKRYTTRLVPWLKIFV